METDSTVYLLDVTSGRISELITYLQKVANDLGHPRELGVIFPQELNFDFSRIRVSVQLSEERLRYEDARQREQDRVAGHWQDAETKDAQRYARRSSEEYEKQAKRTVVKDWEEVRGNILNPKVQRAIILGDPGFGKTWLLRYEGRTLALSEIERLKTVGTEGVVVPIFARLGELATHTGPLLTRLRATMKPQVPDELWRLLEQKAHNGKLFLLFDGWDEVRSGREQLLEAIQDFAREHSQCRLYLTSRIAGYQPLAIDAKEWELVSFTPQQIETFVHNFFAVPATPANQDKATRLIALLTGSTHTQLQGLARIPLMLALLCRLYWQSQDGTLPDRRTVIYYECLWGLLSQWQKTGANRPTRTTIVAKQRLEVLAEMALILFQQGTRVDVWPMEQLLSVTKHVLPQKREKEIAALIDELVADGILVEDGTSTDPPLRFLHLTFHEYLAARALATRVNEQRWDKAYLTLGEQRISMPEFLDHKAWDPRWREVITLCAGQLNEPQPLLAMLSTAAPTATNLYGDDLFRHRLGLAAQCMAELQVEQQQKQHEQLSQITTDTFNLWWENATNSISAVVAHLTQALPSLARVNAEMRSGVRFLDHIASLLRDPDGSVRQQAAEALPKLGSAAVTPELLTTLLALLRNPDWHVRESTAQAVMFASKTVATPEFLTTLVLLLCDAAETIRWRGAEAVGHLGSVAATPEVLTALTTLLCDADTEVRKEAAEAVGHLGSTAATPEILAALVALLRDADRDVRRGAATAVGELAAAPPAILHALLPLLRDAEHYVQYAAADAVRALHQHGVRIFRAKPSLLATLLGKQRFIAKQVEDLAALPDA